MQCPRILLVDDDEALTALLEGSARREGVRTMIVREWPR
jgi:DNA-binding response OmpR family regulator